MTTNDIDAIRKLTDAATPGPWTTGADKEWSDALPPWALIPNANYPLTELEKGPQGTADAEFIAAARTHVPALCDEVEQLRAELAQKTNTVEYFKGHRERLEAAYTDLTERNIELTAERDAARDMANTARHEARQALHALDKARAVTEAAKTWRDWYAASPVRMQHLSDAEEALFAAVDALPTANTDDKPCCGYRCQDNTTGVTA